MSFWDGLQNIPDSMTQCPFWFWNDVLDADLYCSQIDEMARQGVRQAMPHPRYGMDRRAYLTDEYFAAVRKLVQHAREQGFTLYLYDEFNWSSGQAGGQITAERKNCALGICINKTRVSSSQTVRFDDWQQDLDWCSIEDVLLAGYAPFVTDTEIAMDRQVLVPDAVYDGESLEFSVPDGDWMAYAVFTVRTRDDSPLREGNGGIVDYLSADVTRQFIAKTHEQYARHVGEYFGSTIPAIFYDEVGPYACGNFTWTDEFAGIFRQSKGYDLLPLLPLLFFDGSPLAAKVRCDYWDVVSETYARNFLGELASWCAGHSIALVGHGFEESRLWPISADIYRSLRTQQWVGLDSLAGYKSYCMLKTPVSVAHVTGRSIVLAEALGCIDGWSHSPRGLKKAYNQLAIAGVNLLVPHAFFQSVDTPKAECPPSFFLNNPYWRYYHNLARMTDIICYVNRQGVHAADIALLFPLESWWALSREGRGRKGLYGHARDREIDSFAESWPYDEVMQGLMTHQLDYDVLDSQALQEGDWQESCLKLHGERYRLIVLPPMSTIRLKTLRRILELAQAGMPVVSWSDFRPSASMENGAQDPTLDRLLDELAPLVHVARDPDQLYAKIRRLIECDITVLAGGTDSLEVAHRVLDNMDIYLLSNKSASAQHYQLRLRCQAGFGQLRDCFMGILPAQLQFAAGRVTAEIDLAAESLDYLVLSRDPLPEDQPARIEKPAADFSEDFTFLPLTEYDRPYGPAPLQHVQVPVARTLNECDSIGHYELWHQWMKPEFDDSAWEEVSLKRSPALYSHKNSQLFRFVIPAGALALHLPLPAAKEYALYVNGKEMIVCSGYQPEKDCWLPIAGCADRPGILAVETASMNRDFGLLSAPEFLVAPFPVRLQPWETWGIRWYSGFGLYEKTLNLRRLMKQPVWLDLGDVRECAEVRVNGKLAGEMIWPPYRTDIQPFLEIGINRIEIIVCNLIANEYAWDFVSLSRESGEYLTSGLLGPVTISGLE